MEALEKENSNDSTDKIKEKVRVVSLDDSTIIANSMAEFGNNSNASVWSLCGLNSDENHVDLGDISPSISPIFTEQQMADHLTHRLMAEDHIFPGEQASCSGSSENARPIPDLKTDLELFDREMKSMESLDSAGDFIAKKDAGQLTKQSPVIKQALQKRGKSEGTSLDSGIALRTRHGKRGQQPTEEKSEKVESGKDIKHDTKDPDSLTPSDVGCKSETDEKSEKVSQSDQKTVDKEHSTDPEKDEGNVADSTAERPLNHDEQNKTDIEDRAEDLSPTMSQTSTPTHSPHKRVTRSTTGNLKPKQTFDEIQEKYEQEELKKRKEGNYQKKGRKKTNNDDEGMDDSKVESSLSKAELRAKNNKESPRKSKRKTDRSLSITESKESNDESSSSDDDEIDPYADDSDYSPEDDPDRPWCICRKPHGNKFMICCDGCEEWFHGKCVGITMEQGKVMEKQGKEYVCDKCRERKAKEILMAEKAKELAEAIKANSRPDTTHEVHKKPKQKRKVSSTSCDVVAEPDSSEKPGNEVSSQPVEVKKKRVKEPAGYKIPKKVRTTPTPVSHAQVQASKKCIVQGCPRTSFEGAVYCGRSCIERHVSEAVKMLSSKEDGGKLYTSEGNRVSMIEKSSGRMVAGMTAPVVTQLTEWILKNPSFQVLISETSPTSHATTSFYNKVNAESKQKKESDKKNEVDTVRSNVRRMMKDILVERKKESSEIRISVEEIMKLVGKIEDDMYKAFKDTSHRYKAKYRTLMFNLKDPRNKVLYRRVLGGDIPPEKLIWMTSDELATKELAQWREQETKHMIDMIRKEEENTNKARLIKKTHKGEVDVDGEEDLSTLEATNIKEVEETEKKPKTEEKVEIPIVDTTEEHRAHLFDLNCKICTGKMAPPGEVVVSSPTMSNVPIQAAAESSIPSPPPVQDTYTEPLSPDSREGSSDLLSSTDKTKETTVWKGFVMMPSVAKFGTNAYLVSGPGDNLIQVLPDTLHVHGRIAHKHVWEYVRQCKTSSSRELCIIRFAAATDEEKISYVSLYSYFHSRKRCGVIGNCYSGVKDMYLVPLASHDPVPTQLLPFSGPGLQEPRPHMLLGLIVKNKSAPAKRSRVSSKTQNIEPPTKRTSIDDSTPKVTTPTPQPTPTKPSDSPVDEIEDIVFHYHNSQGTKPEPAKPAQSTAIAPMITALLKIQEQEKKLRELQKQSELLEKELAPKMAANMVAPMVVGQIAGVSGVVAGSQSTLTSNVSVMGPAFAGHQSAVSSGISSSSGSLHTGSSENEPYDPETADNEETPYDPDDFDNIDLALDEVPSPDKTTSVLPSSSAVSKTVNQGLSVVTASLQKDLLSNVLGKVESERPNQVTLASHQTPLVALKLEEPRSIPKELEEKVQALLKPELLNQRPANTTSQVPLQRGGYGDQRLNRDEFERMRIERDRGAPGARYGRDFPDRRDFQERREFDDRRDFRESRDFRDGAAFNEDIRRDDPKFYSSRFSLNERRGSEDRVHDGPDHYHSRDGRDDRHWGERGRDERNRGEYYNRNRDRFPRDRWRR